MLKRISMHRDENVWKRTGFFALFLGGCGAASFSGSLCRASSCRRLLGWIGLNIILWLSLASFSAVCLIRRPDLLSAMGSKVSRSGLSSSAFSKMGQSERIVAEIIEITFFRVRTENSGRLGLCSGSRSRPGLERLNVDGKFLSSFRNFRNLAFGCLFTLPFRRH